MKNALFLLMILFAFTSCKKSKGKISPVCDGSAPTYTNFVANLISSKCASCHDYSTYAKLNVIIQSGKFTKEVLTNQTMPEGNSISEADLNKLQCWVENGFPEN